MNAPLTLPERAGTSFADVPFTPAQHLRLMLFGVIARLAEACADGDLSAAVDAHPFLADYLGEIESLVGEGDSHASRWSAALAPWLDAALCSGAHLPLLALQRAGLGTLELELLLAAGLVEEDPRFAQVFERAQGHDRRPTLGLLLAWWRAGDDGCDRVESVRHALLSLERTGLVEVQNPQAPRPDWTLVVPHALWDGLRGESPCLRWLKYLPLTSLPMFEDYIASGVVREHCAALPSLLQAQPDQMLVVRGPSNNGRRTLLGCVARALGESMLSADASALEDEGRWRLFGTLCALHDAMPVLHGDLTPGETRVLPELPFAIGPIGIATSNCGTWSSADERPVLSIELPLPGIESRFVLWQAALPDHEPQALQPLAASARLTSGNIRRAAKAASSLASLAQRTTIEMADLQQACRGLQSARLETLAHRLPARGDLRDLSVDDSTREELDTLLARCRLREPLAATRAAVAQGNLGVRALFAGSSGTGKTLAARLLAASLGKDLYRVDLASTVNKYLGETEKNLNQAFAAAEELDAVLLLDEGDALMASRTDVGSANDRYANLETNFLLQRIESFEGILLVTSNAAERIDKAFARRMDVVIHFRAPDEWRRYDILMTHLIDTEIDQGWLQQVACRCALSGGQWRNVVEHARLLALRAGRAVDAGHLHAALVREYRKNSAQCPLRAAEVPRLEIIGRS